MILKVNSKYFRETVAFVLAILVLFSSSFIVIDEHYCCGKLESFSLIGKADNCKMAMPTCELDGEKLAVSEESCCSNVQTIKSANIFKTSPTIDIDFQKLSFTSKIEYSQNILNVGHANNLTHYKNYIPPLIASDILVFIQCFRI